MKRYYFLIFTLFCFGITLKAQWYQLPAPRASYSFNDHCNGVSSPESYVYPAANGDIIYDTYCFLSPSSGGHYSIMESRNDLGTDSTKYEVGPGMGCCGGVAASSANGNIHAFILNNKGILYGYYTANGFSTITSLNANIAFEDITMACTSTYIYVASQSSFGANNDSMYINRTTISSNTYKYISSYSDSGIGKLQFVNDSTGFMLTYLRNKNKPNMMIKTLTYGATWSTIFYDSLHNITDYCFPTKDTGYLIKSNDSVYRTTDGGVTWKNLNIPGGSFTCIQFANGLLGYIGGRAGFLIKTVNGGVTWTSETSNTVNAIKSLYTFGPTLAYFVDSSQTVYKNQPGLSVAEAETPVDKVELFPNPSNGKFAIKVRGEELRAKSILEVYNMLGEKVFVSPFGGGKGEDIHVDLQGSSTGVYLYRLVTDDGKLISEGKFVIQHN